MKRLFLGICSSLFFLSSCQKQAEGSSNTAPHPVSAAATQQSPQSLYEQCRSGAVQLTGASEIIEEALNYVKQKKSLIASRDSHAYEELADALDSAGSAIADFIAEPPAPEEFQKRLSEFKEDREKAIQAANDAYQDLGQADKILEVLLEATSGEARRDLEVLVNFIDEASKGLEDAIQAMGGTLEQEDEV
jgi:hypothetical protein